MQTVKQMEAGGGRERFPVVSESLMGRGIGEHRFLTLREQAELETWVSEGFSEKDYFVTLTFHPDTKDCEVIREQAVRHHYRRINSAVYGRDFRKKRLQLRHRGAIEKSPGGNFHVHALISAPEMTDRLGLRTFAEIIIDEWVSMRDGGIRTAQKVLPIYEHEGAARYTVKEILRVKDLRNLVAYGD